MLYCNVLFFWEGIEGYTVANYFGKISLALGALLVSGYALSHAHHSHGKPMSEVELQASKGVFDDKNVQDRSLTDWDGVWQSVHPYLQNGDLDPVFKQKAEKEQGKTFEQIKEYYRKGYATDIDTIGIENGVMEFHRGNKASSCQYAYAGHKILTYASGKKGFVICLNVRMPAARHLNTFSSAITSSPRASPLTFISLWATHRRKRYWRKWITGRRTIRSS